MFICLLLSMIGGRSGIRTHAHLAVPIGFQDRPLHPLGYPAIWSKASESNRSSTSQMWRALPLHFALDNWNLWQFYIALTMTMDLVLLSGQACRLAKSRHLPRHKSSPILPGEPRRTRPLSLIRSRTGLLVPPEGVEPSILAAAELKSDVYSNSTTGAGASGEI